MAVQEGAWDCPNCDGTNQGRNIRCQGCGAARGDDVEFYLPDDATDILEDNPLYQQANSAPDWVCGYCDASNPGAAEKCSGCGASVDDGVHRKVTEVEDASKQEEVKGAVPPEAAKVAAEAAEAKAGSNNALLLGGGAFLLVLFLIGWWAFSTSEATMKVTGLQWKTIVDLEKHEQVTRQGWEDDVPYSARRISSERKQRDTRRTKTGTERYKCGKINKGNGFFEDKYCTRDKYKEEPIYDTWVRYKVWEWVDSTPQTRTGTDRNPVYPTVQLNSQLREGGRRTEYTISLLEPESKEKYSYSASEATWREWEVGDQVVAEINNLGSVVSIRAPGKKK